MSNNRDEMSMFLIRISEELEEECHAAILHDSMAFSRLMVHGKPKEVESL